ncbi:MAG TPA: Uma2 family endonuclease [Bryobacteraceae bacterium]|jgi:Uma2 family endonuclease
MTVEQFAQMETADNQAYELVDGELVSLASSTPLECLVRDRLGRLVWSYFDVLPATGGAILELDVRIAADGVRRPDLSIFLSDQWRQLNVRQVPVPFAPTLAVEVISPSEHLIDVSRRVRDYLTAGGQEVWLLDPENTELHVRTKLSSRVLEAGGTLESPLLPGFSVAVEVLLAER